MVCVGSETQWALLAGLSASSYDWCYPQRSLIIPGSCGGKKCLVVKQGLILLLRVCWITKLLRCWLHCNNFQETRELIRLIFWLADILYLMLAPVCLSLIILPRLLYLVKLTLTVLLSGLMVSWSGNSTSSSALSHLVMFSRPSLLFITSREMLASLISSLVSRSRIWLDLE